MGRQNYADKTDLYFGNPRLDIDPLLPARRSRVLEIGCGSGATLAWLKRDRQCEHAVGVELFEAAAMRARQHADVVHQGDAESIVETHLQGQQFDLVLCLDVLEHLLDPWRFVKQVEPLIAPGGSLILSVPNVRNLNVVLPLVLKGRWRYTADGVLDRTHLRFFTLESALELARGSGMRVEATQRNIPPRGSKSDLLNRLSLGLLKDFVTVQYVVRADRT